MNSPHTLVKIIEGPVKAHHIIQFLSHPSHGGQTCFLGSVRDLNHGRQVVAVSYECHKVIAEKVLNEIITEARVKWEKNLCAIIIHGTRRLQVGELSVGIGVSTPHRDEAFQACRYIIEELKIRVPIWKQEHYIDGESEWLKGHELCQPPQGTALLLATTKSKAIPCGEDFSELVHPKNPTS